VGGLGFQQLIPFEEFFAPWIEEARRRLPLSMGEKAGEIAPEALRDLERWLARRLSGFAAEALGSAFDSFRGGRPDGFAVRLAEAGVGRETRLYRAFLDSLLADRRAAWTREFSVLDRLMARAVDLWVDHVRDLLAHWREDGAGVRREILGGGPSQGIARIEAGLSDAHAGGRTVHVLLLDSGARVVYKPRSLGMDVAFARWLTWCNERGAPFGLLGFYLHRLLDRGDRGWAEFVAAEPCSDAEAARRFHLRAGQLLALLHASGARDAHFENLVAHGEHPVLIDLETWLPPRLARWLPAEGDAGWVEATLRLEHSVLSTGLLPRWQPDGPRDDVVNVGGLGGGRPATRLRPAWRAVNTDRMVRAWSLVETGVQPNVPLLEERPLPPEPWVHEVREGFKTLYRLLLAHREEILSPAGPLGNLAGCRGRLIFRPTLAYARLRDRTLKPEACRDAAVRDRTLDALARVYRKVPHPPATWLLVACERHALEQGDIPVFHADLAGTVLEGPNGERIPDVIEGPAVERLRDRLHGLGPEDLEEQIGYLEAALGAPARTGRPTARHFGEEILRRAFRGRDGSLGWIGPRYLANGETFELASLGPDLYGGTAGIALFFAALHRIEGGGWQGPALELARQIANRREPDGIGGLAGLGSRIYTLVAVGELLGETEPIREAHRLAARITPERIAADTWQDVTLGAAGALLALLALDASLPAGERTGSDPLPDPMDIAAACVRPLLAHRPVQAGFAHGAAGIAYALFRFAQRTGDEEARQAALTAITSERRMEIVQTTWCRGMPGIALARLGTLDIYDNEEVRQEIQAALAVTHASALTPMDHLCCGNLGRAEILLSAGEVLGDAGLVEAAREIAGRVLDRAAERGGLSWLPSGQVSGFDPSFFKGAAGAGYTLLRLAAPERLPCVLRLEPPAERLQRIV
jgi:type 2 lantibiotic biosynthesis protein LanM